MLLVNVPNVMEAIDVTIVTGKVMLKIITVIHIPTALPVTEQGYAKLVMYL